MSKRTCLAIVLAAGEGTRMHSARPKVLHAVAGRSLLAHVLAAVRGAGTERAAVVIGPDAQAVADATRRLRGAIASGASIAVLGFRPADPTGYGRLITNGHRLVAIREHRDASDLER